MIKLCCILSGTGSAPKSLSPNALQNLGTCIFPTKSNPTLRGLDNTIFV